MKNNKNTKTDFDSIIGKVNPKNEQIKRKFQKYCKHSMGYSEKTITSIMKAVCDYQEFSNLEDFKKFNANKAIGYKDYAVNKISTRTNEKIKLSTVKDYLRYLKTFFKWLANQEGYKKAINLEHINCLRLSRKEEEIATRPQRKEYPTLEMVKKVIDTIPNDEIGMRDKALISFLLASGGRNSAVASLPIECFNLANLEVDFNAAKGVRMKFGKSYLSYLFIFDSELIEHIKNWHKYLLKDKLYSPQSPLFPQTHVEHNKGTKSFVATGVKPEFWKSNSSVENVVKRRFKDAGLKYYPPHSFRHLAVSLALAKCTTAESMKAVSQNFGHKEIKTTLSSYAVLQPEKQQEIISSMDFSQKEETQKVNMNTILKELENIKSYIKQG